MPAGGDLFLRKIGLSRQFSPEYHPVIVTCFVFAAGFEVRGDI